MKVFKKLLITLMLCLIPVAGWGGVEFDGVDDFIDVGNDISIRPVELTVCVFIFYIGTDNGDDDRIIACDDTVNRNWVLKVRHFGSDSFRLNADVFVGGALKTASSSDNAIVPNTWQYVCFTADSSNLNVYIDGVLVAGPTATGGNVDQDDAQVQLGKLEGGSEVFVGQMTEVSIWNTTLTVSQLLDIYNSKVKRMPLQIQPSSLVGYWPLDDEPDGTSGDGDTFKDLSGNGNDGIGDDGPNNTGLTAKAEEVLSYP